MNAIDKENRCLDCPHSRLMKVRGNMEQMSRRRKKQSHFDPCLQAHLTIYGPEYYGQP